MCINLIINHKIPSQFVDPVGVVLMFCHNFLKSDIIFHGISLSYFDVLIFD
jgi:hypothetical protein